MISHIVLVGTWHFPLLKQGERQATILKLRLLRTPALSIRSSEASLADLTMTNKHPAVSGPRWISVLHGVRLLDSCQDPLLQPFLPRPAIRSGSSLTSSTVRYPMLHFYC